MYVTVKYYWLNVPQIDVIEKNITIDYLQRYLNWHNEQICFVVGVEAKF